MGCPTRVVAGSPRRRLTARHHASHTHGHWLLDRTSSQEVADDLDRSIDLIASHLDVHPVHFA